MNCFAFFFFFFCVFLFSFVLYPNPIVKPQQGTSTNTLNMLGGRRYPVVVVGVLIVLRRGPVKSYIRMLDFSTIHRMAAGRMEMGIMFVVGIWRLALLWKIIAKILIMIRK